MSNPYFSVIIVNYNGGTMLQQAVDSLRSQTWQEFELILVDNASQDNSHNEVDLNDLPSVTKIFLDENSGFARGNNLAAKQARGDWLVMLNPDAFAAPDWLEKMRWATQTYRETAMFASLQMSAEVPDMLDGCGDCYLGFGIPWRGGYRHSEASVLPLSVSECFSPCGAGAVIRRSTFLEHDGFDERFFCYCEDVDLGFRLRLAGENCLLIPSAVIYHFGSAISSKRSGFADYHGSRNRVWVLMKNMPLPILLPVLPVHFALLSYLLLRSLMVGEFREKFAGTRDGFSRAREFRSDHRWRVVKRSVSLGDLISRMSWWPVAASRHAVALYNIKHHN